MRNCIRNIIKSTVIRSIVVVFCAMSSTILFAGGNFVIVKNQRPMAEVILADNASKELKKDVGIFNDTLKKCLNTALPVKGAKLPGKNSIVFDVKPANLNVDDNFTLSFPDKRTMKISCSSRSSRWALNYLLEHCVGVRWLFPGEIGTYLPQKSSFSIPRKTIVKQASFKLHRWPGWSYMNPAWRFDLNAKKGLYFGHALCKFAFPAKKYGKNQSWPMEILPTINGKKFVPPIYKKLEKYDAYWQTCWSHPKTVDIAVENILDYLKNHPKKKSIGLAVNDCGGYCECEACRKAVDGRKTATGHRDYSELYYSWANKVVDRVTEKHPDIYFTCYAYREVFTPPSFKLHPNLITFLCIDIYACTDPEIKKKRFELIKSWGSKAKYIGIYEYGEGMPYFFLPRVFFNLQDQFMKYAHSHGVSAMYETGISSTSEGPKRYLYLKLMWDVDANVSKLLDEWYRLCVGEKAAPYLKEYFQFWENFWQGEDIRKTRWFATKGDTYMKQGLGSYMYALKRGNMARCRKLMEQAVANAVTPRQKERAKILMRDFEYYEATAYAFSAEITPVSGVPASKAQAVEIINNIPRAVNYANKRKQILESMWNDPIFGREFSNRYAKPNFKSDFTPYIAESLSNTLLFAKDQEVRDAFNRLAQNKELPPELGGIVDIICKSADGKPVGNLLKNGSFEKASPIPKAGYLEDLHNLPSGTRSEKYAFTGKYSLRVTPGAEKFIYWKEKALPGETYFFTARVFIPENSVEGYVNAWMVSIKGERHRQYIIPPKIKLVPGTWNLISASGGGHSKADGIKIAIILWNFEKEEAVYIDDVTLVKISDAKK